MTAPQPPGQAPWPGPAHHNPWAARHRSQVLVPVGLIVVLAALVLPVIGLAVRGAGAVPVGLGTLFALLPVVPVVGVFLWIDRWEPEPGRLLLMAFLWGAGVAALTSVIGSVVLDLAWAKVVGPEATETLGPIITAPVVEEAFKGLFLVLLLWRRRREFDGLVDGIVYAGLVGVGFAFTENIMYLGNAVAETGIAGGVQLFFFRCVLSPFAHPIFTAMTGIAVGMAARSADRASRIGLPVIGYLGAVFLHGLWNGSASILDTPGFFAVYGLVMVPLFIAMIVVVVWQRRREERIVATQLPQFVAAGWIAPEEVRLLVSLSGRRGWRKAVQRRSGAAAARAVHVYHVAVTELAFLRDRMSRGAVGPEAGHWHQELLTALFAARTRAIGHPQALTAAWNQPPPPGWQPPQAAVPPGPPGAQVLPHPPGAPGYYR